MSALQKVNLYLNRLKWSLDSCTSLIWRNAKVETRATTQFHEIWIWYPNVFSLRSIAKYIQYSTYRLILYVFNIYPDNNWEELSIQVTVHTIFLYKTEQAYFSLPLIETTHHCSWREKMQLRTSGTHVLYVNTAYTVHELEVQCTTSGV